MLGICDKVSRYDIRGKNTGFRKKIYIQAAYLLSDEKVIEREFEVYSVISDNYPKYVITLDRATIVRNGIIHLNLIDFLLDYNAK